MVGAAGAAYSSIVQGIGNAAYFGDAYSLQKLAFDTALGAATAGLLNGAGRGVQYLKGKWGRAVPLGETPLQTAPAPGPEGAGEGIVDGFTAQFPEYSNGVAGGTYNYNSASGSISSNIQRFNYFGQFQAFFGKAGAGRAWHHIVEQNKVGQFGQQAINSTDNIVNLPHGQGSIHSQISAYYSSKPGFSYPLTVRDWLKGQSWQQQHDFGISIMKKFGWKP